MLNDGPDTSRDHDIDVATDLIETLVDAGDGCAHLASEAAARGRIDLSHRLRRMSSHCARMARELAPVARTDTARRPTGFASPLQGPANAVESSDSSFGAMVIFAATASHRQAILDYESALRRAVSDGCRRRLEQHLNQLRVDVYALRSLAR